MGAARVGTVLCCAHAISENGSHALGAQAGEAQLADVFAAAGFGHWRRAAETPFNLVLEARVGNGLIETAGGRGEHRAPLATVGVAVR